MLPFKLTTFSETYSNYLEYYKYHYGQSKIDEVKKKDSKLKYRQKTLRRIKNTERSSYWKGLCNCHEFYYLLHV